jgi:hypothetical protein
MLWWWDSEIVAILKRNDESWDIPIKKVIEARSKKERR